MKEKILRLFDLSVLSARHVLLNVGILIAMAGGCTAIAVSSVGGLPAQNNVVISMILVLLAICFYIANAKKKVKLASTLICFVVAFLLFPLMYFAGGGINSGMPLWFSLGILFTFLMIEGKACVMLVVLDFAVDSACILVEYYYPQMVTAYQQESGKYFDIWQSMLAVCLCIGLIIKFQNRIYDRQISINEKQKEQLIQLNKEAEESKKEAEAANRAKSDFLASMSHEIRTPINAVLGMDEMILRECKDANILEYAQNIENSGHALLSLINDILDFSKIEAGKMELITADYELGSLLHDCYNMIQMRAESKNLKFTLVNDPNLPRILYGDEFRLRQIFVNLLTNAVKYTHEGAVVFSISGEKINENRLMLVVSVKDTGIGISEENQQRLFQSFQRLEEKKNRSIEGTGLGLTIVKRLVDLMDATLELHSVYGEGSEFVVKIPQIVLDWQEMGDFTERYSRVYAEQKAYNQNFAAPDAKVLVVDDVDMNLQVARNLLKNTKVQVDTAGSGEECLRMVENTRYDIIFMDHMMPIMDGVETMEKMKLPQYEKNIHTPVIMLTANAILGVREQYLQVGFCDYLSKPVTGADLEEMLLKYLPDELIVKASDQMHDEQHGEEVLEVAQVREDEENSIIDSLRQRIEGIDIESGIEHCGESEELYLEILGDYAAGETLELVEELFKAANWEQYSVQVHALKSTSLTIGLPQLSEKFKGLEFASKEADTEYLQQNHAAVIEDYKKLLDVLREILG